MEVLNSANLRRVFYTSYKKIIFIFMMFATTSCGAKLSYNYLDWIIPWYVSDYVSLNEQQKAILSNTLEKKLHWHRAEHLPQYIQLLNSIQQDLRGLLSYEQIEHYYITYNRLYSEILRNLTPDIARLLSTATEKQIIELLENLRRQNERLRLTYITPPEESIIQFRTENTTQKLLEWTKYLTDEQQHAISTWSTKLNLVNQQWMYQRLLWQQNFKIALKLRHQGPRFEKLIQQLFLNPKKYWPPKYLNTVDENEKQTIRLYQTIAASLNTEQKQYLLKKIEAFSNDLQDLAQNG